MFVGSFEDDFSEFQSNTQAAVAALQQAGVTRVLIDLTNNNGKPTSNPHGGRSLTLFFLNFPCPGGFVCLGVFLHAYFAGSNFGYARVPQSIIYIRYNY